MGKGNKTMLMRDYPSWADVAVVILSPLIVMAAALVLYPLWFAGAAWRRLWGGHE